MPEKLRFFSVPVLAGIICIFFMAAPAAAFTAQSLSVNVDKSGDATAVFSFSLDGPIENAIPQAMLEEELVKGLTTTSEPPEVISFDRSSATLLLKKFAQVREVETGTEYQTAGMDFNKAQIALQNSALNYVISADFSPQTTSVTFPDGYKRTFTDSSTLPSLSHIVIDPAKQAAAGTTGTIRVTSSPVNAKVFLDSAYIGDSPGIFPGIAPGQHIVTVEYEGFFPATRTVIVEASKNTTVSVVLAYSTPTPLGDSDLFPGLPGFDAIPALLALAGAGAILYYRR